MTDPSQGYAPFWDRAILGLHSLPLWLSPALLVWALRRRQVLAVWLLAFAAAAFFTPALIDFGPIFESEYLRWQFAAGLGCAGALGLALPTRWWPLALLYLATGRLKLDGPGPLVYRGAHHWITHQRLLDFSEDDWQAAQWLREHSRFGETVLTHPLARPHQVSFESTLCGLTALRASRRLPLPDDEVGLVPSRQRPDVACFLASKDPDFLALTPADWVLWRQPATPVNGTRLGQNWVSRVQKAPPPGPLTFAPPLDLPIEGVPAWAEQGKIYPLKVNGPADGRLVLGDGPDRIPCGRQPLWQAPYRAGRHSLATYWWDSQGLHPLKRHYEVRVDTLGQMTQFQPEIQAIEIQPSGKLDGWGVLTARVRVPFQDSRDWIGGARFLTNSPELEPLTIEKKARDVWQWQCRVLLPPAPGRHAVDLWLSPFHGAILRLRGPHLEITANFYPASR